MSLPWRLGSALRNGTNHNRQDVHGIAKKNFKTVIRKLVVGTITSISSDNNNTTIEVVGEDHNGSRTKNNKTTLTLVTASPQTGRTHQIRRHAATSLGMPIIGDTLHGDSKMNRWWRQQIGLNRLALHCCLAVKHAAIRLNELLLTLHCSLNYETKRSMIL
jgi:23S rRNA-/tRNA-specific pseudouridylate synthase